MPHTRPFLFLQPPHTGTSTVISGLALSYGCEATDNKTHLLSQRQCGPLQSSPLMLHNHDFDACYALANNINPSFAFVRDPWSRVLSCAAWNLVTFQDDAEAVAAGRTYGCSLPANSSCAVSQKQIIAQAKDADGEARTSLHACKQFCERNAQSEGNGCNFAPQHRLCQVVTNCKRRWPTAFRWGGRCMFASRIMRFRRWAKEQFSHGHRGKCHFLRNNSEYTHCNGTRVADYVGSTHSLQDDFASVCRLLQIPEGKCVDPKALPRHCLNSCAKLGTGGGNKDDTSASEYAATHGGRLKLIDAYDDATRELVARTWAKDIALFNFSWERAVFLDV